MRKINYYKHDKSIEEIKKDYFKMFSASEVFDVDEINKLLNKFNEEYIQYVDLKIDVEFLLTSSIDDLVKISRDLKTWSDGLDRIDNGVKKNDFTDLFRYSGANQEKIAAFFMEYNFRVCHYCDEQYISSFVDFSQDYIDYIDFLNNASDIELELLKDVGPETAKKICNFRKRIITKDNIDNLKIKDIEERFKQLLNKKTHNYFTLDHVLPQNKYTFFSLSLFNLVPACYSCNSKYKKAKEFDINNISYISPTSENFNINQKVNFLIQIDTIGLNINDFSLSSAIDNFTLNISVDQLDYVGDYLRMFKLNGRYLLYKDEINKIINKRIQYPDSLLENIGLYLGREVDAIKKDLFSDILKDPNSNELLSKMKNDIAKQLKL